MLSIVKSLLSPLLCSNCETPLCSHPETATTRWDQPPSFNLKITPNVLALISYRQQYIACLSKIFERHIFCKFLSFFNILYFSMEYLLDQISTHIVFWSKQLTVNMWTYQYHIFLNRIFVCKYWVLRQAQHWLPISGNAPKTNWP